jgi:hypothetical protein
VHLVNVSEREAWRSHQKYLFFNIYSSLPSPTVAVASKKSHTKLGSLTLYRILHWLPVLPPRFAVLSEVEDKVLLLRLGADDYVTKPFQPKGIARHVRVGLRRVDLGSAQAAEGNAFRFDELLKEVFGYQNCPPTRTGSTSGSLMTL